MLPRSFPPDYTARSILVYVMCYVLVFIILDVCRPLMIVLLFPLTIISITAYSRRYGISFPYQARIEYWLRLIGSERQALKSLRSIYTAWKGKYVINDKLVKNYIQGQPFYSCSPPAVLGSLRLRVTMVTMLDGKQRVLSPLDKYCVSCRTEFEDYTRRVSLSKSSMCIECFTKKDDNTLFYKYLLLQYTFMRDIAITVMVFLKRFRDANEIYAGHGQSIEHLDNLNKHLKYFQMVPNLPMPQSTTINEEGSIMFEWNLRGNVSLVSLLWSNPNVPLDVYELRIVLDVDNVFFTSTATFFEVGIIDTVKKVKTFQSIGDGFVYIAKKMDSLQGSKGLYLC